MPAISRGLIKSYDSATHSASVQIAGSLAVWLDAVPVSDAIAPADVVTGRECGVIFFADDNPMDAAVVTIHNKLPIGSHRLRDADGDTYIDVERTANENKIAMYTAGTLRWLLQNTTPHATLTGDLQVTGGIGVNIAPDASVYALVRQAADATGKIGLLVDLGGTTTVDTTAVVGIAGKGVINSTTGTAITSVGLDFLAGFALGGTAVVINEVDGVRLGFILSGGAANSCTVLNGVKLVLALATTSQITDYYGVNMTGSGNAKLRTVTGLFFGSFSNAAATPVPIDADGPARTNNTAGSVHRMNFQFGSRTRAFGTGDGVIGLAYATTNPSTNPAGGVVNWADAGSGDTKWRGAGGQVCKLPTGGAINVTGARGGNVALANLLTALAGLGLITDSTT
ncbi:MAG: hypothetical protein ABI559_10595 [Chloroflexota bacterium]